MNCKNFVIIANSTDILLTLEYVKLIVMTFCSSSLVFTRAHSLNWPWVVCYNQGYEVTQDKYEKMIYKEHAFRQE